MTINTKFGLIAAGILTSTAITPAFGETKETATTTSTLEEALKASKPIFNARLRYETVDQNGITETANALTYRLRAGVETGKIADTSFLIEFDHVEDLIDDFNSTTNGKGMYPVVVDPNVTELNRLQLTNTSLPDTKITLGRQRIVLDDSRFIGNVGWRQNEQTYDALRVTNTGFGKLTVDVAYINRVNRIFGDEHPTNGHWTGDSYIANVSRPTPLGKLTGFGYLLDSDEASAVSSQTLGLRLAGKKAAGEGSVSYTVSYAKQTDYGSSNLDYDADYYLLDAAYGLKGFTAGIGYEVLGGDDQRAFNTPFATVHKFQGWADKFLVTPVNGIEDLYVKAGYKFGDVGFLKGVNFLAIYHDFASDVGSTDYGSEIDLVASANIGKFKATLKYADYSADSFATDTSKLWAQLDFAF